jgi:hypothetical protein
MRAARRTTGWAHPRRLRGLTMRSAQGIRNGVVAVVAAAALGLLVAAPTYGASPDPVCCNPDTHGPHVFGASFSGGKLHETLTFHNAGKFFAHILSNPRSHGITVPRRTVPLGFHTAGKTRIGFRLGILTPGRWAVVVTPQTVTVATTRNTVATWVYFTVRENGKLTNIRLVTDTG